MSETPAVDNSSPSQSPEEVFLVLPSLKKEERHSPTDVILSCKDHEGRLLRIRTHRHVLRRGSVFFQEMFDACKSSDHQSESKNGSLEVIPMEEDALTVAVLLYSMYGHGNPLKKEVERREAETSDQHA